MQRDFLINSLKTKTKYNMTTTRKRIKQQSAAELMEMFKAEIQMNMPMFVVEKMVREDTATKENKNNIITEDNIKENKVEEDSSEKVVRRGHRSVRNKKSMAKDKSTDLKSKQEQDSANKALDSKTVSSEEVKLTESALIPNKNMNAHASTENVQPNCINAQNKRRGAKIKITPKKMRDSVVTLDDCDLTSKLRPYKNNKGQ